MMDCYDFDCEEYIQEDEVIKAITLLSDTKIRRIEEKYVSVTDFVTILYFLWFVEKEEISQIANRLGENVGYIYRTMELFQWNHSHDVDENSRLSQEYENILQEAKQDALRAVAKEDFEGYNLYRKAKNSEYYQNGLKKAYKSFGFKEKEDYLKFLFYLVRVRKESLTPEEIGRILSVSSKSISEKLNLLGIALSRDEAMANMVNRGRKDMTEILRKGRKSSLRSKEATTSSISENRFRSLLSENMYNFFGNEYEVIVGINTFGILEDLEIDIPIVVMNEQYREIHKFCVEYNGTYYHNEEKDLLKAQKAAERGWYYIPVYEGNGSINSSNKSIEREAERVCKTIFEIVTEGETCEIFDIIKSENEIISKAVKRKNEVHVEPILEEFFSGFELDEVKIENIFIFNKSYRYEIALLLSNISNQEMKMKINNIRINQKKISGIEERFSVKEGSKEIVSFSIDKDKTKGMRVQEKKHIQISFDYQYSDKYEDIIEDREYSQMCNLEDEHDVVRSCDYKTRDDLIFSLDGLEFSFLGAYSNLGNAELLCYAKNNSDELREICCEYLICDGIRYSVYGQTKLQPNTRTILSISVYKSQYIPIDNKNVKLMISDSWWKSSTSKFYDTNEINNVIVYDWGFSPEIPTYEGDCIGLPIYSDSDIVIHENKLLLQYIESQDRTAAFAPNYQYKYKIRCPYKVNNIVFKTYINGMPVEEEKKKVEGRDFQEIDFSMHTMRLKRLGVKRQRDYVFRVEFFAYRDKDNEPYCQKVFSHVIRVENY